MLTNTASHNHMRYMRSIYYLFGCYKSYGMCGIITLDLIILVHLVRKKTRI